jgi:hypothetical protein
VVFTAALAAATFDVTGAGAAVLVVTGADEVLAGTEAGV